MEEIDVGNSILRLPLQDYFPTAILADTSLHNYVGLGGLWDVAHADVWQTSYLIAVRPILSISNLWSVAIS